MSAAGWSVSPRRSVEPRWEPPAGEVRAGGRIGSPTRETIGEGDPFAHRFVAPPDPRAEARAGMGRRARALPRGGGGPRHRALPRGGRRRAGHRARRGESSGPTRSEAQALLAEVHLAAGSVGPGGVRGSCRAGHRVRDAGIARGPRRSPASPRRPAGSPGARGPRRSLAQSVAAHRDAKERVEESDRGPRVLLRPT